MKQHNSLINVATLTLQNRNFGVIKATQFQFYKYILIDEVIVSLQNPPVWRDKAICIISKNREKIDRSEAYVDMGGSWNLAFFRLASQSYRKARGPKNTKPRGFKNLR